MLRTVMSSVMRRRRGLISAIWKLLSEGSDRHPHPLRQETCHATKPLTPRQRLRSIPQESPPKAAGITLTRVILHQKEPQHGNDQARNCGSTATASADALLRYVSEQKLDV